VFFRAKDFASVEKVLGGMVGVGGIVLPEKLAGKLEFLEKYGVKFGAWLDVTVFSGVKDLLIIIGMVVFVLVMKNSQEWSRKMKPTLKFQLIMSTLFLVCILSLSKVSAFLYFQF
jgi:hypothetical protein